MISLRDSVSAALLLLGLGGYGVLLAAYGWRLVRWRPRVHADLVSPRGFAFLTVVAASNVLAGRLAADGNEAATFVFLAVGVAGWLLLGYGIPLALITGTARGPSLDQVSGTWFLWAVATQSVAVAAATLNRLVPGDALAAAVMVCWAIGLVQYSLIAGMALARLLLRTVSPAGLTPSYWVFMGAAAISVLAGAKLLELPARGAALLHPVTTGLTVVLWSFCTWLIPLLLALGLWRHVVRRVPLRYEANLWSLVFPVGMYGVATRELGRATRISWLTTLGGGEAWVAAAVWAAVFMAMIVMFTRTLRTVRRQSAGR